MSEEFIPKRLKEAREKAGITRAEASRRLNLSKIGYNRYESGERKPSLQTLQVIAHCFHTSVSYLTGATDDMSPDSLVVSRSENPELFELVNLCQSSKDHMEERLLRYMKELESL